ncbi:MAG: SprT-like domain-containing protein [Gammaproteobacteria bacterium]|nr:SprT-like domain-containing protein [Gammaproteobacteria bacterium]MBQ0841029.1 SprT-like domain-containing protein [Gammaproteobacteria bacterium]
MTTITPAIIAPINAAQQAQVLDKTQATLALAERQYGRQFTAIPVLFDLRGRCSGMYRVRGKERVIRFNPHIFAKYFSDNLATTVPHEVAHYVSDCLYGLGDIRPHGEEWRGVMQVFKADDSRTAAYDLEGIPTRRQRYFDYRCVCQSHRLSSRRHYKLARGEVMYNCRQCGENLNFVAACQVGA